MSTKARMKLATGPAKPMSIRCHRGWDVNAPGSSIGLLALGGILPGHLDVTAQGQQADLVIGVAALDAKEARPESDGKCLDANAAKLGNSKVAKFVHHHHHANQDNEGDGGDHKLVKILHEQAIVPLARNRLLEPST